MSVFCRRPHGTLQCSLLLRNDSVYATLYSIGSQTLRDGDSTFNVTDSVNETITVPTGVYKVAISLGVLNNATGTGGTSGTSTLSWELNNDINEFIFGSDGFTSWHPVNSMYHSEEEGLFVKGYRIYRECYFQALLHQVEDGLPYGVQKEAQHYL